MNPSTQGGTAIVTAGDSIIAGHPGQVAILDAEMGTEHFVSSVPNIVTDLAFTAGRLFAVTDNAAAANHHPQSVSQERPKAHSR